MKTVGPRTEECVSSLGDQRAPDLCREAEPKAFCVFLKPLHKNRAALSWNRASPERRANLPASSHPYVDTQGLLSTALRLTGTE